MRGREKHCETRRLWKDPKNCFCVPTCLQLRKRVLFYFQKLSSVPVIQLPKKSLQVLRFFHDLVRLFIKKLKKFAKKIFLIINFTRKSSFKSIPDLSIG